MLLSSTVFVLFAPGAVAQLFNTCVWAVTETSDSQWTDPLLSVPPPSGIYSWNVAEFDIYDCDGNNMAIAVSSTHACAPGISTDGLIDELWQSYISSYTTYTCSTAEFSSADMPPSVTFTFPESYLGYYDIISGSQLDLFPVSWTVTCTGPDGSEVIVEESSFPVDGLFQRYSSRGLTGQFNTTCDDDPEPVITGDPYVITPSGERIQFWLPLGNWVSLLKGERLELRGRAFGKPFTTEQWLDGVEIRDLETDQVIFSAVIPQDVPVGSLGDADSLQFIRASLDGEKIQSAVDDHELISRDGLVGVRVSKLPGKQILGKDADSIVIRAVEFAFKMYSNPASKHETTDENAMYTHLNFKFTELPEGLTGFFAEVLQGNVSDENKPMLTKPVLSGSAVGPKKF